MIWVAGVKRIASKNACIGFHGMYDLASGQPSADANAIAGAHLGLLGLSLDAVFWMLTPRQLDTHWLTDEAAEKYGIYWTHDKDDPGHSCPNQRGEASGYQDKASPPAPPPGKTQQYARYETVGELHLRAAAAPDADDVLGYLIPVGSEVFGLVTEKCQFWYGSGRGEIDADNLWCPVIYGKQKGWANALYLRRADGKLQGCVSDPRRNGCPR